MSDPDKTPERVVLPMQFTHEDEVRAALAQLLYGFRSLQNELAKVSAKIDLLAAGRCPRCSEDKHG